MLSEVSDGVVQLLEVPGEVIPLVKRMGSVVGDVNVHAPMTGFALLSTEQDGHNANHGDERNESSYQYSGKEDISTFEIAASASSAGKPLITCIVKPSVSLQRQFLPEDVEIGVADEEESPHEEEDGPPEEEGEHYNTPRPRVGRRMFDPPMRRANITIPPVPASVGVCSVYNDLESTAGNRKL